MKTIKKYIISFCMLLNTMQICAMDDNEQELAPELELVSFMLDMNIIEESEQMTQEQNVVEKYDQEQARQKGNENLISLLSDNVDCAKNVMKFLCEYAGDARPSLVLYGSDRQIVPWIIAKQRCAIVQAVKENKYKRFKKSCELLDMYTLLFISPDAPGSADFIKNYKSYLYECGSQHLNFSDIIWNKTLLHITNESEFVAYLLRCGIHENHQDFMGWTPLHESAWYGKTKITQLLLDHGANIDIQDKYGCSPLTIAARAGRIEVVKLLLDRGANPHIGEQEIDCEKIRNMIFVARMCRAASCTYEANWCAIM